MGHAVTESRSTSHSRKKWMRRRREIIRAALEAGREKGYHATTLDDIAGRLGIRKAALYHYFADKDAILPACHRESLPALGLIVVGFLVTILAVGQFSEPIRPVLPWWSIVGANSLSVVLAGTYLLPRHPGLWRRITPGPA